MLNDPAGPRLVDNGMAAVTMTGNNKLVWDFTLARVGSGSDTLDQLVIQFGADKLFDTDCLLITLAANGQSLPVFSREWTGIATGTNGILMFYDWDTEFPDLVGTLTIELLQGSVEVTRATLVISTPADRLTATVSPNVTLVPEVQAPLMVQLQCCRGSSSCGVAGLRQGRWAGVTAS